jgi:hypothetical protein
MAQGRPGTDRGGYQYSALPLLQSGLPCPGRANIFIVVAADDASVFPGFFYSPAVPGQRYLAQRPGARTTLTVLKSIPFFVSRDVTGSLFFQDSS